MAGWTRHGVVAVALLTTGACTTPRYAHPEAGIPVPESWVESQVPPAALDLTAYWQLLDDPLHGRGHGLHIRFVVKLELLLKFSEKR